MNNRILLFGALIGAVTGLAAALMLQRRAERTGMEISLSAGEANPAGRDGAWPIAGRGRPG